MHLKVFSNILAHHIPWIENQKFLFQLWHRSVIIYPYNNDDIPISFASLTLITIYVVFLLTYLHYLPNITIQVTITTKLMAEYDLIHMELRNTWSSILAAFVSQKPTDALACSSALAMVRFSMRREFPTCLARSPSKTSWIRKPKSVNCFFWKIQKSTNNALPLRYQFHYS